ncbi:D-glycero-alpha-D-manno-heptose 7-phosphate kinase [subsurface metagenome]
MKVIYSRAPVRVCDIGGWTDTWFYKQGAVINFCVDLYSYIRVVENNSNSINIISENLDLNAKIKDYRQIEYDGILDLLKAAVKRMEIKSGLDIYARSDAPPSCGTGTSASIAVALIGALSKFSDKYLSSYQIAELAHKLETEELGLESGVQDQYAAAFGGINFMEINYPVVKISNIKVDNKRIFELESQMILVYFGSRSSSEMHLQVIENYKEGNESTIKAFDILKESAYEMVQAISSEDIHEVGEIMNKNWEAQKALHSMMTPPIIKKTEKLAFQNGAIGFKCNGAGGGGSAVILAEKGCEYDLKKALLKEKLKLLPCKLNFKGLEIF